MNDLNRSAERVSPETPIKSSTSPAQPPVIWLRAVITRPAPGPETAGGRRRRGASNG
jgi:hypothetical protein